MRGSLVAWTIGTLCIALIIGHTRAELYTSMDELSYWTSSRNRIVELMDQKLYDYSQRLEKLKQLRQVLARALELDTQTANETATGALERPTNLIESQLSHPVGAYIALNRLVDDLNEARYLLEEEETPYGVATDFEKLVEEGNLPSEDDALGSGKALLRLQRFYNLKTSDLAEGKIVFNNQRIDEYAGELHMDYDDIFLLGKLSADDGHFELAMEWLELSLQRAHEEALDESESRLETDKYNYLLEYMSYAAYKTNRIHRAALLTRLWAEREPRHEKAVENDEYYARRLAREQFSGGEEEEEDEFFTVPPKEESGTNSWDDPLDERAQLCRSPVIMMPDKKLKCLRIANLRSPNLGMKIEILSDSPRIIRVYDILTEEESQGLKKVALPRLARSTVGEGAIFKTSDSRIAKTAWLPNKPGSLASKLRDRIDALMRLDLRSAEELQIVNYGLGGFYDLHWDAFTLDKDTKYSDEGAMVRGLVENNRLATVLMYLDHVKAGGATIFPKLNLHAQPIKRSAIIWYNLHKNRTVDVRTRHMGCPVLLGSKWIATIWPREKGNTFLRPCGLNKDD